MGFTSVVRQWWPAAPPSSCIACEQSKQCCNNAFLILVELHNSGAAHRRSASIPCAHATHSQFFFLEAAGKCDKHNEAPLIQPVQKCDHRAAVAGLLPTVKEHNRIGFS